MRHFVYDRQGKRVASGDDLAVVLRYARKSPVNVVTCKPSGDAYTVTFWFDEGERCDTSWQDWRVLVGWLLARRSWSINRVTFDRSMTDKLHTGQSWLHVGIAELLKRGTVVTLHAYQS